MADSVRELPAELRPGVRSAVRCCAVCDMLKPGAAASKNHLITNLLWLLTFFPFHPYTPEMFEGGLKGRSATLRRCGGLGLTGLEHYPGHRHVRSKCCANMTRPIAPRPREPNHTGRERVSAASAPSAIET